MLSANSERPEHGHLTAIHRDAKVPKLSLIHGGSPAAQPELYEKTERFATLGLVHLDGERLAVSDLKVPKMLEAEAAGYADKNQANTMFAMQKGGRPETVVIAVPQGVDYRKTSDVLAASVALMRQGRTEDDKTPTRLETILAASAKATHDRALSSYQNQPAI